MGDAELESVVVEEKSIEMFIKEAGWKWTFKLIESEIQELEGGEGEEDNGEGADEAVVAEVELVEELHAVESVGKEAAEAVGVEVEEGQVG